MEKIIFLSALLIAGAIIMIGGLKIIVDLQIFIKRNRLFDKLFDEYIKLFEHFMGKIDQTFDPLQEEKEIEDALQEEKETEDG